MSVVLERTARARHIPGNHPDRPSPYFLSCAAVQIKRDPSNVKALRALAFADTVAAAAQAVGIEQMRFSILLGDIRRIMGPGVRNSTAMVAFSLDTGLLDAETISKELDFERYKKLSGEDKTVVRTLAARKNWGKSQEELAVQLVASDMTDYRQQVSRLCSVLGVGNLMQLRVYELLRVKAQTKAEPDPDSHGSLSPQEIRVIELKACGLSYKEIAGRLGEISANTVKKYMANIVNAVRINNGSRTTTLEVYLLLINTGVLDRQGLSEGLDFSKYGRLTEREREVLKTLVDNSNQPREVLGSKMVPAVSAQTYKNHLSSILHKLGVSNYIQAAVYYTLVPEEIRQEVE
jgi:DNA-binding NarL/FixJ family response regulator